MTNHSFILRPAHSGEGSLITELNITTRRVCYAAFMPADFIAANLVTAQKIANWEKRILENDFLYIAETPDGIPVGFAWGGSGRHSEISLKYELYALYVLPHYQKMGLGRQLIEKFADYIHWQPFYLFMLNNNPVKDFYNHLGGIRHDEYMQKRPWENFTIEVTPFFFNLQQITKIVD